MAQQSLTATATSQENLMALSLTKILCPIDFDPNSIVALDTAAEIARDSGGTLEVLHVVPIDIQPGEAPIYVDVYSVQEQESKAKMKELARTHLAGVNYELRTAVAQPAVAILHAQRTLNSDIIVMGTHGRRGFAYLILGSVAERVVREAECPVLTVRATDGAEEQAHLQA